MRSHSFAIATMTASDPANARGQVLATGCSQRTSMK
jgi:hypothetical protein